MALRNIENALPISQERPKKLPKLSKQPEIGLNDENNPVVLPESAIEYVASENLKPVPDPALSVQVSEYVSHLWSNFFLDDHRFQSDFCLVFFVVVEEITRRISIKGLD